MFFVAVKIRIKNGISKQNSKYFVAVANISAGTQTSTIEKRNPWILGTHGHEKNKQI